MTISRWKALGILGIALGATLTAGAIPRLRQRASLAEHQHQGRLPPRVRVEKVRLGDPNVAVTLPGNAVPFRSSALYAKSTGFVAQNHVDVGARVKAGQLLSEIDAPETAEELRLAEARLAEARANVGLAEGTAERARNLRTAGVGSQQQVDDTHALANSALATVATRQAELQRLRVLRGYQRIVAPFDGIITRRGTDPGALVGTASSGGVALFEVADTAKLRVFVEVPDAYAADIKPGLVAQVYSPRNPSQKLTGTVALTSGVLEQASRTLRTEVHIRGDGAVLPGAFVYVRLQIPTSPPPLAPANALIVRKEGTLVAKVENGKVALTRVTLGRDFGKEVEVLDGVRVNDLLIVNPSDELETGHAVEVLQPTSVAKL